MVQKGQEEAVDVLRPSHHLIATWHSSVSRCMFKPTEGMAETQELAWGADALTTCELCWLVKQKKLELGTCGCQVLKIVLSVEEEC